MVIEVTGVELGSDTELEEEDDDDDDDDDDDVDKIDSLLDSFGGEGVRTGVVRTGVIAVEISSKIASSLRFLLSSMILLDIHNTRLR